MSLGKNIRRLRWATGRLPTQSALAQLLGVPQTQVSDWENDRYAMLEVSTLIRLAKVFHCSLDELIAGIDPGYDRATSAAEDSLPEGRPDIAVVAEGDALPAGTTYEARGKRTRILGWLHRPGDLGDSNAYAIQIRGDSMLPAYRPNLIVIVSPEQKVRKGDEVYAQLASGESLVRLAHPMQGGCILQPYNPAYASRFVRQDQCKALHVIVYSLRRRALSCAPEGEGAIGAERGYPNQPSRSPSLQRLPRRC